MAVGKRDANSPIAVESDSGVGQNSEHETNGRPGVTVDTEKATFLGVLPSRAGDDDEISRSSWMHRLQFHGLKERHEKISDYSGHNFKAPLANGYLNAAYKQGDH